ncbi:hypothetical protein SLS62_009120 [Diatrype stigma]|uniref:RRM domain-containing protein n=1 Tax=Diatrype stigma TaxID=117547 RepID=A0AAN9UGI1_9PEZI
MGFKEVDRASIGSSIYAMMPSSPDPFLEGSTVTLVPSGPEDILANEEYARLWPQANMRQLRLPDSHDQLGPGEQAHASDPLDQRHDPQRRIVDGRGQPKMGPPQPIVAQQRTRDRLKPGPNSDKYKGDPKNPQNQCADIPVHQSTCLFITKLPTGCTANQLLGAIRGVGKVWALSMCEPTEAYETSAAKLTFWDRAATNRFLQQVAEGRFRVGDRTPCVLMNWYRTPSQPPSRATRVLGLAGPARIVNQPYLEGFFRRRRRFEYTLDKVVTVYRYEATARLEFHFASYRCQAAFAAASIRRLCRGEAFDDDQITEEERELWRDVHLYWGVDPCALP